MGETAAKKSSDIIVRARPGKRILSRSREGAFSHSLGPRRPSQASARDGSYRRMSCRQRRCGATGDDDPSPTPTVHRSVMLICAGWREAIWSRIMLPPSVLILTKLSVFIIDRRSPTCAPILMHIGQAWTATVKPWLCRRPACRELGGGSNGRVSCIIP